VIDPYIVIWNDISVVRSSLWITMHQHSRRRRWIKDDSG